jgi:hypothetical protein
MVSARPLSIKLAGRSNCFQSVDQWFWDIGSKEMAFLIRHVHDVRTVDLASSQEPSLPPASFFVDTTGLTFMAPRKWETQHIIHLVDNHLVL